MNPYAKILSLLESLPAEERLLLSGVRRDTVDTRECGCLFGTLLPKHGLPADTGYKGLYHAELLSQPTSPLRHWARDLFNLTDGESWFGWLVAELERVNDNYDDGDNDSHTCADRYQHVCEYLRKRAADYAVTPTIPDPNEEEEEEGDE